VRILCSIEHFILVVIALIDYKISCVSLVNYSYLHVEKKICCSSKTLYRKFITHYF
jgi:hypothetical protein